MTFLNKYPHIFNYPTNITTENALQQYTNATKMIRFVKFTMVLMFSLLALKTIQSNIFGTWFLPLVLGVTLLSTAFFVVKSLKSKTN